MPPSRQSPDGFSIAVRVGRKSVSSRLYLRLKLGRVFVLQGAVIGCSSRVVRKYHARFSEGWATARLPGYSALFHLPAGCWRDRPMLSAQQAWHGRDCSRTPELFTKPSDKSRLWVNGTVHEGVRAVQATSNSRPAIETESGTLFHLKRTYSPRAHIFM